MKKCEREKLIKLGILPEYSGFFNIQNILFDSVIYKFDAATIGNSIEKYFVYAEKRFSGPLNLRLRTFKTLLFSLRRLSFCCSFYCWNFQEFLKKRTEINKKLFKKCRRRGQILAGAIVGFWALECGGGTKVLRKKWLKEWFCERR